VSTPSGVLMLGFCNVAACSLTRSHTSGCAESQRAPAASSGSAHCAALNAEPARPELGTSFFPAMGAPLDRGVVHGGGCPVGTISDAPARHPPVSGPLTSPAVRSPPTSAGSSAR